MSNKGRDFYIGFFENYNQAKIFLSVTTNEEKPIYYTVSTTNGILQTRLARKGEIDIVSLPAHLIVSNAFGSVDQFKGIHINAENGSLIVQGFNEERSSTDAFLALPVIDYKGVDTYSYFAVATNSVGQRQSAESLIVASEDNTLVTITASKTILGSFGLLKKGKPRKFLLNRLSTLLLKADTDISGSKIESDKPISFFTGQQCAQVPNGYGFCDILVEQMPPVQTWGNAFITSPLKTRRAYDVFYTLGSVSNTRVYASCYANSGSFTQNFNFIVNEGEKVIHKIKYDEFCWIEATQPILLVQLSVGISVDNVNADPFMVIVPPLAQFSNDFVISTVWSNMQAIPRLYQYSCS